VPERPGTTLEKAFEEVKELSELKKGSDLKVASNKAGDCLGRFASQYGHACMWGNHYA
jgi:DNA polymerase-3 subunit alpha